MIGIDEADFVVVVVSDIHFTIAVDADTERVVKKRGRADAIG